MNNMKAIFCKQAKDTMKNKAVLIQFLMFPVISIIMNQTIKVDNLPEGYFIRMFAVMYIGMAPIIAMSSIIAEEREKNTLRVLLMSNVKPGEYLLGTGTYVWIMCMLGAICMGIVGGYGGTDLMNFLILMAVGFIISILLGASIGGFCKNQMVANSMMVPAMLILAFVPMMATFNTTIEKYGQILYSQQIQLFISHINDGKMEMKNYVITGINMVIVLITFVVAYRKNGLDE